MPYYGADPEFFFEDKSGNPVAAEKLLPFKDKPMKYKPRHATSKRCDMFADGVQAEFTTRPVSCRAYFADGIHYALQHAYKLARRKGLRLAIKQAVPTPPAFFDGLKEESYELGCDPDFIAWMDGAERVGPDAHSCDHRFAGGHIHIGASSGQTISYLKKKEKRGKEMAALTLKIPERRIKLVKVLDATIGNFSVLLEPEPEAYTRRQAYGVAGSFRPKDYGVEYRTLSNYWLRNTFLYWSTLGWIKAISEKATPSKMDKLLEHVDPDAIIWAINECDRDAAWENWERIKPHFVDFLVDSYSNYKLSNEHKQDVYHTSPFHMKTMEFVAREGWQNVFGNDVVDAWILDKDREVHHGSGLTGGDKWARKIGKMKGFEAFEALPWQEDMAPIQFSFTT